MPNDEIADKIAKDKEQVGQEIAALYVQLTGQERREVAVAIRQSDDTVYRYSTDEVKKLPIAIQMRDEMKKVLAKRDSVAA